MFYHRECVMCYSVCVEKTGKNVRSAIAMRFLGFRLCKLGKVLLKKDDLSESEHIFEKKVDNTVERWYNKYIKQNWMLLKLCIICNFILV